MSGDSSGNGWTVVTGASSGIGLAFARELARPGHRVLAVARRRDRLEALAREPVEQGGSIVPLAADLRTREGLALVIERITCLGTIDLLVNNAGVATFGDFQNSSLDQESLTACEHVALLRVTPKLSLLQPSLSPSGFQREHLIRKQEHPNRAILRRMQSRTSANFATCSEKGFITDVVFSNDLLL